MNNHPYNFAAGQRPPYYNGPDQPVPPQQQSHPAHGVQTFQHHGYLPQPIQRSYPANQSYGFQQPQQYGQENARFHYNGNYPPPSPQSMGYRPQATMTSPHLTHYDGVHRHPQGSSHQYQQQQMPAQQTYAQAQAVQEHNFHVQQHQSQLPPLRSSPQVQAQPSPQQLYVSHQDSRTTPDSSYARSPHQTQNRQGTQPSPNLQQAPQQQPQHYQRQHQHQQQHSQAPDQQQNRQQQQQTPQHHVQAQQQQTHPPQQHQVHASEQHQAQRAQAKPTQLIRPPPKPLSQSPLSVAATMKSEKSSTPSSRPVSQASSTLSEGTVIALAEEYLIAASEMKRDLGEEHPSKDYFRLLGAGLRCLKVALTSMRLQPVVEAAVRLRYASVLFAETEDFMTIEETLSSGIALCDRNRLADLKYDMIHLLTRCMFKTKPRAALKYLDTGIRDVESTRYIAWMYAFRILRASLAMQLRQQQEVFNAVTQLKIVSDKAAERGDRLVSALAAVMEAHIHVSRNNTAESIEQAQCALASVRSLQHTPQAATVPQLTIIAGFIDVACNLYQANTPQIEAKMRALQQDMDDALESPGWNDRGICVVPVSDDSKESFQRGRDRGSGVIQRSAQGDLSLRVSWLDKEQIYGIGYMLNAISRHHRNASDENASSENLLREAQLMFSTSDSREPSEQGEYVRRSLRALLFVNRVFEQCSRNRWAAAKELIIELKEHLKDFPETPGSPWQTLCRYLDGVTQQATGNMDRALEAYHHESLSLPQGNEYRTPYERELALLATMNSLLVVRNPDHPLHGTYAGTLSNLGPLAQASPSKNIFSAYNFVRAAMPDLQATSSILDTKGFLQTALQAAKATSNNQLMCITLNILSYKFFRGVVGEQAEKSGRATQTLAKKGKDSLWLSVADGALAETLEGQGKTSEARQAWTEAVTLARRLPNAMKVVIENDTSDGQIGLTDQFAV